MKLCSTLISVLCLFTSVAAADTQTTCLTKAIYFESRGEPLLGQYAVAHVVLNRVYDSRFPNTICEVVQQTKPVCQFSWYCDGKPDVMHEVQQRDLAKNIAVSVLNNSSKDPTNGALYFNSKIKKGTAIAIGNHVFYRGL